MLVGKIIGMGYDCDKKFDEMSKMKKKNEKEKKSTSCLFVLWTWIHTRKTSILVQLTCEKIFEKYSLFRKILLKETNKVRFF